MLGIYYRIWIDGIARINLQSEEKKKNWQSTLMMAMTLAMTFNFALIVLFVEKYLIGNYFYKLNFSFLPEKIANILSNLILFFLPCLILNYLLIFNNKRYEKLLQIYSYKYDGKLFLTYVTLSIGLPVLLLFVGLMYFRLTGKS